MFPIANILLVLALLIGFFLITLPVRWAAVFVGARHVGYIRCFLTLLVTSFLYGVGLHIYIAGPIVAFLLASAGYAGMLGTSFPKGIVIAVLHIFFGVIMMFLIALIFGIGFGAMFALPPAY